jgi:hypothetical protein
MTSMSEVIKNPNLAYEDKAFEQKIGEMKKITEAIPNLAIRFHNLLMEQVKFPENIKGKPIKLSTFNPSEGNVIFISKCPFMSAVYRLTPKKLSPTELKCLPKSEEGLAVSVESESYPFERWEEKVGNKQAKFTVKVEKYGWIFKFNGKASMEFENTILKDEKLDLNKISALEELIKLIENPEKTTYSPTPHHLDNLPRK